jgi:flagellar assembly protein FliH
MVSMGPIIRAAPVSPVLRRVGRPAASAVQPAAALANGAPLVVPFDGAAELARNEKNDHQAALHQRDAEIESLRRAAEKRAAELSDAYADAERRGYAAGEKKGEKAALAACDAQAARVKALVAELAASRDELLKNNEDAMVGVVFAALCRIIGETGASRDTIRAVVRHAVAATRQHEQLVVRLHPDDAALLEDQEGDSRLCADPSVKLGGCIVDSANGSLDARFETQLELLAAALQAARAAGGRAG